MMRFRLRTLIIVMTALCLVLGVISALSGHAIRQRRAVEVLVSHFGNQPWMGIRYRGRQEYEEAGMRSFTYDAWVPIDGISLFTTQGTDDVLESIAQDISAKEMLLRDTDVTERGVRAIMRFKRLEELTITDTDLSTVSVSGLLSMRSLRKLRLKACRLDENIAFDLPMRHGQIEIIRK